MAREPPDQHKTVCIISGLYLGIGLFGSNFCLAYARARASGRTGQPAIADNLSKAGWSWGCVSAVDRDGRTIWIADAHRGDGKRFVVRADEKLTAFVELE
jgi:hypothetical protein